MAPDEGIGVGGLAERSDVEAAEAIIAFLDGKDFEDVVRLAVSLGGDADTQAAIAGGIAACVYPIPEHGDDPDKGILPVDCKMARTICPLSEKEILKKI